jgi:hypothetical protein
MNRINCGCCFVDVRNARVFVKSPSRFAQRSGYSHTAAASFGSSIETRSLPSSLAATQRDFTFYVAAPASSIVPLNFGGASSTPKFSE